MLRENNPNYQFHSKFDTSKYLKQTSTSSGVITKDTGTKQYETMHSRTGPIHDEMSGKTLYCIGDLANDFILLFFVSDTQMQVKTKKFKFTIIGDGYIYYMLSDMQCKLFESKIRISIE